MAEHTPTPWAYRPNKHDDWGWIRDAEGALAATARDGRVYSERYDEFRAAGKDPFEPNAAFIVKAVNAYDEMQEVLADLWLHFSTTDDPALRSIVNHARQLLPDPGTLSDVGGTPK